MKRIVGSCGFAADDVWPLISFDGVLLWFAANSPSAGFSSLPKLSASVLKVGLGSIDVMRDLDGVLSDLCLVIAATVFALRLGEGKESLVCTEGVAAAAGIG